MFKLPVLMFWGLSAPILGSALTATERVEGAGACSSEAHSRGYGTPNSFDLRSHVRKHHSGAMCLAVVLSVLCHHGFP